MESNIAGLYDLDKVLGKGHYGIVRLARHVFSGQEVAVKVIDKTKLDQRETEHLLKEVQCMKLVRHPNVVRLYQVISTKNKLYLVLELGSGGDLLDYLNKMPHGIGEEATRDYFCQIIRAIAYCHHLHIVHRDLKPENIIFNSDYSVLKLTDFGFSNEFSPGEKLMTYCGSWKYSAPEILLQEEYDPPAVDVWSLGVMLFQMVAGRLPFSEVNESETLTKIMDGSYEMPEDISDDLKNLLSRMIVVEPKDRITVDDIVNHAWCVPGKKGGPINGLVHEVGITDEEHETVAKKIADSKIASRELLMRSLKADSYDYISATYLLLAEQLKQKRVKAMVSSSSHPENHITCLANDRDRRGSMPEVNADLLSDIKNRRWKVREAPESSRAGCHDNCQRQTRRHFRINNKNSGSSSCSEEDPSKSPSLGGDKFLRDEDTFFKGKLKASPKRTTRRPLGSLNIHAISSSSEDSEDDEVPTLIETLPRSKTLTRLFRRTTPPSTRGLVNIEEGSEDGGMMENVETVSHLGGSRSNPNTLKKKKLHSPLQVTSSLESAHSSGVYAEEAVDMVSPLSTPLSVQRKRDGSSNQSSFSSSVELSSDDSDMDLAKRKKLVGLSKRDRTNISQAKKVDSRNMMALVQKLKHLESHYQQRDVQPRSPAVTPSSVLPNISEPAPQLEEQPTTISQFTDRSDLDPQRSVKYIRHPIQLLLEDIEPRPGSGNEPFDPLEQFGGATNEGSIQRYHSTEDQLPIELFGSVKSTVCSIM